MNDNSKLSSTSSGKRKYEDIDNTNTQPQASSSQPKQGENSGYSSGVESVVSDCNLTFSSMGANAMGLSSEIAHAMALEKRKIRNRESALASRERKRQRMIELERENQDLRRQNMDLENQLNEVKRQTKLILARLGISDSSVDKGLVNKENESYEVKSKVSEGNPVGNEVKSESAALDQSCEKVENGANSNLSLLCNQNNGSSSNLSNQFFDSQNPITSVSDLPRERSYSIENVSNDINVAFSPFDHGRKNSSSLDVASIHESVNTIHCQQFPLQSESTTIPRQTEPPLTSLSQKHIIPTVHSQKIEPAVSPVLNQSSEKVQGCGSLSQSSMSYQMIQPQVSQFQNSQSSMKKSLSLVLMNFKKQAERKVKQTFLMTYYLALALLNHHASFRCPVHREQPAKRRQCCFRIFSNIPMNSLDAVKTRLQRLAMHLMIARKEKFTIFQSPQACIHSLALTMVSLRVIHSLKNLMPPASFTKIMILVMDCVKLFHLIYDPENKLNHRGRQASELLNEILKPASSKPSSVVVPNNTELQ